MITGTVNANREAILRLAVRNTNGQEHERDAVVDTGFDGWLSLPPDFILALGLQRQRSGRAIRQMAAKDFSASTKRRFYGTANPDLFPSTHWTRNRW